MANNRNNRNHRLFPARAIVRLLFLATASLSLNGCAAFAFTTYSQYGFYADHGDGETGNTYSGCEVHDSCGEVKACELYGNC